MADATTAQNIDQEYTNTLEGKIKTSEVLVVDGVVSVDITTGLVENADDTADLLPIGLVVGSSDRDNSISGLTGDGNKTVIVRTGNLLNSVTVAGVSAITDFGKFVYATDNQTFTLTKPTAGIPIGWVKKWRNSTTCDVQMFTSSELLMMSYVPQKERIFLGIVTGQNLGGTSAADLLKYTAYRRMQLDTLIAMPMIDDAVLAGDQDVNLEIGSTNVTGTMALAYTDCNGVADLGTAVTQALTGSTIANQGDEITLELVASGTGFTDETLCGFMIYVDVTYLPGA